MSARDELKLLMAVGIARSRGVASDGRSALSKDGRPHVEFMDDADAALDAALAYRDSEGRPAIVDALVERGVLKRVVDYESVSQLAFTDDDVFVACDIEGAA